jgi:hypothetical protein
MSVELFWVGRMVQMLYCNSRNADGYLSNAIGAQGYAIDAQGYAIGTKGMLSARKVCYRWHSRTSVEICTDVAVAQSISRNMKIRSSNTE